ncbi:MAG: filamentous hemagglutinin N-terminal domain-containing protein [Candidatus Thorarchaeota archaeon]
MKVFYFLWILNFVYLFGKPDGFNLIDGKAFIKCPDNQTMNITTGNKSIINWNNFSINNSETVRFIMPNVSSSVLNRVVGINPSKLMGSLEANGKIFLINPNGILIGEKAVINAASFIASTFDVLNDEFMQGKELLFDGNSKAKIVNLGKIKAWDGDVILIGYGIQNKGLIETNDGKTILAAEKNILLKPDGTKNFYIKSKIKEKNDSFILKELKENGNPYAMAIKDVDSSDALNLFEENGDSFLITDKEKVELSGSIVSKNKDGTGGEVYVLGREVVLQNGSIIDVSNDYGKGKVFIGGGYKGKDPLIYNSKYVLMEKEADIKADALKKGKGGEVVIWGDNCNYFYGQISARGGKEKGDGGFVEISSKGDLGFHGIVNTQAFNGKTGMLLLDPCDITISAAATNPVFVPPVYNPNADTANLNATDLMNALAATQVQIRTDGGGTSSGDITVNAQLWWGTTNSLTLIADRDIIINQSIWALNTTLPSSTLYLKLQAGRNIQVGDGTQTVNVDAGTLSGKLFLEAGNDINVTGSSNANCKAQVYSINGGDIDVEAGNDINVTGGAGNFSDAYIFADDDLLVHDSNDINIYSQAGQQVYSYLYATNDLTVTDCGDITLDNTSGGDFDEIFLFSGHDVAIENVGNIILNEGSSDTAFTYIGSYNNVQINNAGNISLTGATGPNSDAYLFASNDFSINNSGDVNLTALSGNEALVYAYADNDLIINDSSISLQSGTGSTTQASLYGANEISIDNTSSISLSGGSGLYSKTYFQADAINVTNSGPITLTAGSVNFTPAYLYTTNDIVLGTDSNPITSLALIGSTSAVTDSDATIKTDTGNISIDASSSIVLTAGTNVGGTNNNASILTDVSGDIDITISGNLNLTASLGGSSYIGATSGSMQYDIGENLNITSSTAANAYISCSDNMTFTHVKNMNISAANDHPAYIKTTGTDKNISINSGASNLGYLNLTASGGTSDSYATIQTDNGGDIDCTLSGTSIFRAGSGSLNSHAGLYTGVTSGTGNITVINGGSITLFGGSGGSNNAEINAKGTILAYGDGSFTLNGGSSDGCKALIQATDNIKLGENATNKIGNLSLSGSNSNCDNAGAAVFTTVDNKSITIYSSSSVSLTGGTDSSKINNYARIYTSGDISLTADSLNLTAGNGNGSIATVQTENGGDIDCTLSGTSIFRAGSGSLNSHAGLYTGVTSGTGNITVINGGSITLFGGSGGSNNAEINAKGTILAYGDGSFTLNGGSSDGCKALIQATDNIKLGENATNKIGNLSLSGSNSNCDNAGAAVFTTVDNKSITIYSSSSVSLTGGTDSSKINNYARIYTSGDISLTADSLNLTAGNGNGSIADICSTSGRNYIAINDNCTLEGMTDDSKAFIRTLGGLEELLLLTGKNLDIGNFSSIYHNGTGDITLVVDNLYPLKPFFGGGQFILNSSGSITTGGNLRIFTSVRSQNIILDSINGVDFIKGNLFENSAHEQWGFYYPNSYFGGPGFTIFYKNATSTTEFPFYAMSKANFLTSEMLFMLKGLKGQFFIDLYDERLLRCKEFSVEYRLKKPFLKNRKYLIKLNIPEVENFGIEKN